MIFSNPTEYALRALTELAGKGKEGYVMLGEIIPGRISAPSSLNAERPENPLRFE